jgi:DNA-binding transcriptional LysR family regulator
MDIHTLEDFLVLGSTRSFTLAANARNSTLPAFTRRIRKLEGALGATLVDRTHLPVKLTRAGELYLAAAREAIGVLKKAQREIAAVQQNDRDIIYFSLPHTLASHFFPQFLTRLRRIKQFEAQLIISTVATNLADILDGGLCHLMIYFFHPDVPVRFTASRNPSLLIGNDRLVPVSLAGKVGDPLFPVPGSPDRPTPHLYQGERSYIGQILDIAFARKNTSLFLTRLPQREGTIMFPDAVRKGLGVAWLPEQSVAPDLATGDLVLAAEPEWVIPLEIRLARSSHILPEQCETLWSALADEQTHLT